MKWCYIAAPYTVPDPVANTHRVIKFAEKLLAKGWLPIIPHLTLLWHAVMPKPPEFWYEYTMELMKRCDVVIRLHGFSEGADREVDMARKLGIEVLFVRPAESPEDLLEGLQQDSEQQRAVEQQRAATRLLPRPVARECVVVRNRCPDCGGHLVHEGGCAICRSCGWSECG